MYSTHENEFDAIGYPLAHAAGVPYAVVKGVMAHESLFDPHAYRAEPQIGDASRGLMQILLATAKHVGFTGPADLLFDPSTNLTYGIRYLREVYDLTGGNWPAAFSAYNGGYRPTLGYGRVLPSTGKFANQAYVDAVQTAVGYFTRLGANQPPPPPPSTAPASPPSTGHGGALVAILVALAGVAAWVLGRR